MSWADIFYPGNPERRNKVTRLLTKLLTHMEDNFVNTNDLIDIVHEHLSGKTGKRFKKIYIDRDGTIKENCEIFITRINEIQAFIKEKKKKLKETIDLETYKKIMDTNVTFSEKVNLAKKLTSVNLGVIGTVTGVAITASIMKGKMLVSMAQKLGTLKVLGIASIGIMAVFIGIDMIASAIMGAVQRDQLEQSIKDLKAALAVFEPASREYDRQIIMIEERVKMISEAEKKAG